MKLLDERGRVLGVVNLLDLAVVVLILAGGALALGWWSGRLGGAGLYDEAPWRWYRVKLAVDGVVAGSFVRLEDVQYGPTSGFVGRTGDSPRSNVYARVLALETRPWKDVAGVKDRLHGAADIVVVTLRVRAKIPAGETTPRLGRYTVRAKDFLFFNGVRSKFYGIILDVRPEEQP